MAGLTSDGSIEFTCPDCRRRFATSLVAVELDGTVHRSHCGTFFDYHKLNEQVRTEGAPRRHGRDRARRTS